MSSSSRRRRRRRRKYHRPSRPEWRDWSALPSDILYIILSQLPQPDILRGAGLACSSWRQVAAEEPLLWRHIDLAAANEDAPPPWPWAAMGWLPMACAAVDRSAGRCESFRGRVDFEFLLYLADKAPSLRSLQITSWFSTTYWFTTDQQQFVDGVIKKPPLLEKFVVSRGRFDGGPLQALVDHCPRLRTLDVGGCGTTCCPIGKRRVERWRRRIKELWLPKFEGSKLDQEFADKYDCCRHCTFACLRLARLSES